jgi:uncharacterized protein (UPF0218 family)
MLLSCTRLVWVLPPSLRKILSRPLDKVYKTKDYVDLLRSFNKELVITVGDTVSKTAVTEAYRPRLMIVDNKTMRVSLEGNEWKDYVSETVWNPAGTVTLESLLVLRNLLGKQGDHLLFVDGEEDLLALPTVILAPEGSLVCYGQPGEGVVCINVNKAKKKEALLLFKQLEVQIYE